MANDIPSENLTLRVAGLGHSITIEVPGDSSVGTLKSLIEEKTNLPSEYQKLLARGSKLEDDALSLSEAGIKDRTKIMLMHSAVYASEKDGFEQLSKVEVEITELAAKKDSLASVAFSELVTRICCKLDEIPTNGSANLRSRRKALLQRAQALDTTSTAADQTDDQIDS